MFTALSRGIDNWKQLRCPPVGGWVNMPGHFSRISTHDGMKGRMISQSLSHSKRKGTLARSFCECCCPARVNRGALGCFGLCVPTPRECSKVQHWDRPTGSHLLLFWAPKHAQTLPSACSCVPHPRGRWREGLVIFSRSQQRGHNWSGTWDWKKLLPHLSHTLSWDSQRMGTYFSNNCYIISLFYLLIIV